MNDVLDFLRQQQSISLEQLCSFLRIPSVSADSAYAPQMGVCAEWVRNSMTEAGLKATIYPTKGHPIIYGERIENPALPTVLVYGHYDVQPRIHITFGQPRLLNRRFEMGNCSPEEQRTTKASCLLT